MASRISEEESKIPRIGGAPQRVQSVQNQIGDSRTQPHAGGNVIFDTRKSANPLDQAQASSNPGSSGDEQARESFARLMGNDLSDLQAQAGNRGLDALAEELDQAQVSYPQIDEEEASSSGSGDQDLDRALETLRRNGMGETTIKAFSREAAIDTARAMGSLASQGQQTYQQLQTVLKSIEDLKPTEKEEAPKAGQPSPVNLKDVAPNLFADLGESADELKAAVEAIMADRMKQLDEVTAGVRDHESDLSGLQRDRSLNLISTQRSLVSKGPLSAAAEDDGLWRETVQTAVALGPQYQSEDECFASAAAAVLNRHKLLGAAGKKKASAPRATRRNQPPPPTPHRNQGGENEDQYGSERRAFRHLLKRPGDWKAARAQSLGY